MKLKVNNHNKLLVWLGTLGAYVLLALVEEAHLAREFGEAYIAYRDKTPFLIPFVVTQRRLVEIATAVVIPALLLWGLVLLNRALYPQAEWCIENNVEAAWDAGNPERGCYMEVGGLCTRCF